MYKAVQLSVNREVALKVLRSELVGTSKAVQRLQREARNTARLHHPNIISAIDMGEVSGRWWYAMELVAGPSLARRIKQEGALSEREALRTFTPLAAALQHLSELGIVHRDIKPANIVLENSSRALLIDLGLAFSEEDPSITRGGGTLGTPHYISPEQARDPSSADVRSDIWSLGATMYHAVCGEPPFVGASVAEIMSRVLYSRVPDPQSKAPHLSRGYALVLRKCLAREPERRYQTPAELLEDLERLRERRAPHVTKKELDPLLLENRGRLKVTLGVGALVLLAASLWLAATRPWEESPNDLVVPALTEWKPLEEFAAAPSTSSSQLAERYTLLLDITRTTPERFTERAAQLRVELDVQLEQALFRLKRRLDRELESTLRADDLAGAEELLERRTMQALFDETGFRPETLPELRKLEFGNWLEGRRRNLAEEIESRETRYRAAVELHLENTRRDVRLAQDSQRWERARSLLGTSFEDWLSGAQASAAGLSAVRRAELVGAVELQRNMLSQRLENAWYELDTGLKRFVTERARELEEQVLNREVEQPAELLAEEFQAELKRIGLRRDSMPTGLSRYGLDEMAAQQGVLVNLAGDQAREDAIRLVRRVQEEHAQDWARRDYSKIVTKLESRIDEQRRQALRVALEQVLREARSLEDFLMRAARGVEDRDGAEVQLALGTSSIQVSGRLRSGVDPLERGFEVEASRNYRFQLRGPVQKPTSLVSTRDVRVLAGAGADPSQLESPELRLATALFLFREGDALESLAVLSSGELPADLMVEDLDERIHVVLRAESESEERDLAIAKLDLELLRREWRAPHDSRRLLEKCQSLLTNLARFLSPEELAEVRSIRASLRSLDEGAPTIDEFQRIFGPHEIETVGPNEVRMRFAFDEPEVGAWQLGEWRRGAFGWECPVGIPGVVGHPGPSLNLRKPFDVNTGVLHLDLEIEQLAPAQLFAVSVVGFQVLFSGGESSRCLVHSGSLQEAVDLLNRGEGRPFTAFEREGRYSLRFEFNKASGDVNIWIDGERFDRRKDMRASPIGQASSYGVTLSSIEPVRVLSATIQGRHE